MTIKITSTKEHTDKVNILVYGKAGMGKTYLCSTAPNPLIISTESGLLSLKDFDLPVIKITSIKDMYDAYEFITESSECKKFETICLDSITDIAEVMLIAHKRGEKDPRQAYGKLADDMADMIRGYRDMPEKHVYFTAKQSRIVDADTGIAAYQAGMPGNTLKEGIAYFFDEVACIRMGELDDGETYRYLQLHPDIKYDCKDRSGELDKQEKPDLTNLINRCLGNKKQEAK